MNGNIANPWPLGFGVLGIALWMLSVIPAGIAGPMGFEFAPGAMHGIFTVAMLGLLIAGIAAFLRRESWLGFFFLLWSGLFWAGGFGFERAGGMRFEGWFLMTITLVNFYLWFAAWKSRKLGGAVSFMLLLLWLSFLCYGLNGFFGPWVLLRIGGALGLASALVSFYISATTLAVTHYPERRYPGILYGETYPGEAYPGVAPRDRSV
jgi:succinate-acetate transporter protein